MIPKLLEFPEAAEALIKRVDICPGLSDSDSWGSWFRELHFKQALQTILVHAEACELLAVKETGKESTTWGKIIRREYSFLLMGNNP